MCSYFDYFYKKLFVFDFVNNAVLNIEARRAIAFPFAAELGYELAHLGELRSCNAALGCRGSPLVRLPWCRFAVRCATTVWAATAPELDDRGGVYCEDCGIAEPIEDPTLDQGVLTWALDPTAAKRLWSLSEEWSDESFPA